MASTSLVLAHATIYLWVTVAALILRTLFGLVLLVAALLLAWRNGQGIKKVSWSPLHGFTAEFFEKREPQSGNQ